MAPQHFDDPVAAYDQLAPEYAALSRRREAYLRSVEAQIIQRVPASSRALLDIGAGDGARARRIAAAAQIVRVVLLEPSARMADQPAKAEELWRMRAEDLDPDSIPERFDVITCLWNTLGHVAGTEKRTRVLLAASRLLSARGTFFLDVTNRYNARSYGLFATCARWAKDVLVRDDRNGDVTATWKVGGSSISTYGHVFTHREIMRLADASGLRLQERLVIDYETGRLLRLSWQGNLLYVFRRSSRTDSSSASATS